MSDRTLHRKKEVLWSVYYKGEQEYFYSTYCGKDKGNVPVAATGEPSTCEECEIAYGLELLKGLED